MLTKLVCSALTGMLLASSAALAGENPYPRDWFWGNDEQRAQQDALIGEEAPLLDLSHWINGEIDTDALDGKIVVVDFWATWCGPCIGSIPHNNEMSEKYADQDVLVIGICGSSRGQESMGDVAEEHNIQYPVARDADLKSAQAWSVMWWPTYGVIDREGKVRALGLKPSAVDRVVDGLLAQEADSEEADDDASES